MSENINNNENFDNSVSGVERVSKKKGKKIALISGITAVALVGGGVAAYNLSDYVKNQVNLRVMKPENYYSWVTEENAKSFASTAKEKYQKAIDRTSGGQSSNVTLKYTASEGFKDYALNEILGDQYSEFTDDESQMIVGIINNINEVAIGGSASVNGSLMSGNAFLSLNGENLISGDIAMDYDSFDYFLRVPELTEQWLCVSLGDMLISGDELTAMESLMENPAEYLSADELEDLIIRYTNVWNESVSDVEVEKKESVDICDIIVDYTMVSAELNEAKIVEIATNYINELKNDDVIKNIFVNKLEICTEDEYVSELDDILTELSEEEITDDEWSTTLDTYIDPNGDIRGIKLYDDTDEFFICFGKDGENVRGEIYSSEENAKDFSMELYADESDGKYSGNIDLTSYYSDDDNDTISVEFTDYEVVNEDNGYFNASVTLVIPDVDPIHVDFASDGNAQDISYNINFDGTDYGTVTLSMSVSDSAEVSVPSKDGAFIIDYAMDSEPTLEDYIPEESMKNFIYDILVKIGFSEEIATDGADDIAWEMYSDYDDYDDYDWDYYDDFGGYDDDLDFTYDDFEIAEETTASDSENVWNPDEEGMFSTGEADEIVPQEDETSSDEYGEWIETEQSENE
ncbi:MAG: hypothetical protein NC177_04970 [Ruminococcus flavefaciens]|nr:hypothetical protein [Ruminococcus flavefaciens]